MRELREIRTDRDTRPLNILLRIRTVNLYSVCRLYAPRCDVERLLKEHQKRRSEISARRQGDTNYRNLPVFSIIYASWDRVSGVSLLALVDYPRLSVSFCVARRFTYVRYCVKKNWICMYKYVMREMVRRTGRMCIRRFH